MSINARQFLKAKHTPALLVIESLEKSKELALRMVKEEVEAKLPQAIKNATDKVISEASDRVSEFLLDEERIVTKHLRTVVKGDKGEMGDIGEKGERGFNGDNGKDGITPIKGVDYFDGEKGKDGKNGINGKSGKDGKDGSSDKPEEVAKKLNKLTEEVNMTTIKGLTTALDRLRKLVRKGGGAKGGGMTFQQDTPTGTVDGSNVTFTVPAHNFGLLFVNGQLQAPSGEDYTLSETTVTFVIAPLTNSVLLFVYA